MILIIPEKIDAKVVQYAAQARYEDLVRAGVRIMLFSGGLLHAKTITVDARFSPVWFGKPGHAQFLGSIWRITLLIYDQDFTIRLLGVQQDYMQEAREVGFLRALEGRAFMVRTSRETKCPVGWGPLL